MELSLFLAKLLGLYFLITAGVMLFRKEEFINSLREFLSSNSLILFAGFINLILGLAIVLGHPVWEWSWRVIITILGYLSIVKGFQRIAFPAKDKELGNSIMQGNGYWAVSAILVILGAFLTYKGFGF